MGPSWSYDLLSQTSESISHRLQMLTTMYLAGLVFVSNSAILMVVDNITLIVTLKIFIKIIILFVSELSGSL